MTQNNEVSKGIREIIPMIAEWIKFTGFYHEVPGVSIAIRQYDDVLLEEAYGVKSVKTNDRLDTSTLFRIASHSKVFTATAIMELYAQDKLSLDDRISKYLDWFQPKNNEIRIHHLLSHASGITRDATFGQWYHHKFPSYEEFQEIMQGEVEILEPSVQVKYSNIAFTLLGRIIEKVSGMSYEDYMTDLCSRLGLQSTYPMIGETESLHATGHQMRMPGEERETFHHVEARSMNPATGFSSIPSDILKFYRAHMLGQELGLKFGDFHKREMQRSHFKTKEAEFGYGFGRYRVGDMQFVGHSGGYPGFITVSRFNPEKELGISIFTNTLNPPLVEMFNSVVGLIQFAEKEYEAFDHESNRDFKKYEGLYRSRWGIMMIHQFNQKLLMVPLNFFYPGVAAIRLDHVEGDKFVLEDALPGSSKGEHLMFVMKEGDYELHMTGTEMKKFQYTY